MRPFFISVITDFQSLVTTRTDRPGGQVVAPRPREPIPCRSVTPGRRTRPTSTPRASATVERVTGHGGTPRTRGPRWTWRSAVPVSDTASLCCRSLTYLSPISHRSHTCVFRSGGASLARPTPPTLLRLRASLRRRRRWARSPPPTSR